MTAPDPRVILPVDPQGNELLVFAPQQLDMISGWAVVVDHGKLFVSLDGEDEANGAIIRMRFGFDQEPSLSELIKSRSTPPDALGRGQSAAERQTEEGHQIVVRELYVTAGKSMSGRFMQKVALNRYEAAVNTPEARAILDPLMAPANMVAWPWDEDARLSADDRRPWWVVPPARRKASRPIDPPQLRLEIPKGYGRPDSFYKTVAERYAYLARVSLRPANELAEANDVPVTTVHGWVKEARKRGFLPSRQTRKGDGQ